ATDEKVRRHFPRPRRWLQQRQPVVAGLRRRLRKRRAGGPHAGGVDGAVLQGLPPNRIESRFSGHIAFTGLRDDARAPANANTTLASSAPAPMSADCHAGRRWIVGTSASSGRL